MTLSPEDIAWVDSCLSKDPDIPDDDWNLNSLKEALLESSTTQNNSSLHEKKESIHTQEPVDVEILPEVDSVEPHNTVKAAINRINGTESSSGNHLDHENNTYDDFWSSHKAEDIFLPTYNENLKDFGPLDRETSFDFQAFESDQVAGDVFKTWDLELPVEEVGDDLSKQLSKALEEKHLDSVSPGFDDNAPKGLKDLQSESLDDLISGIADLALSSKSGED